MRRSILRRLAVSLPAIGLALSAGSAAAAGPVSCSIDLVNNSHSCWGISQISFTAAPSGGQTAMRINLDPRQLGGFAQAVFNVTYSSTPTGMTVNIGDSATNNGGAGDAFTQQRDSELQISGQQYSLFGDDLTPNTKVLQVVNGFATAGSTVSFAVSNNRVTWTAAGGVSSTFTSANIFALNGQSDSGGVNYDIYAAFNRVIDGNYRSGTGVSYVTITLWPASE